MFSNKEIQRTHTRKYLGAVFKKNGLNYFIPFSSAKNTDYIFNNDGTRNIRKSIIPIIRMTSTDVYGQTELKGTLKLSNMIPVPQSELINYDLNKEPDLNYKILVTKEYEFIRSNTSLIMKNANVLYSQKTNAATLYTDRPAPKYLANTVDFKGAEDRCKLFMIEQQSKKRTATPPSSI